MPSVPISPPRPPRDWGLPFAALLTLGLLFLLVRLPQGRRPPSGPRTLLRHVSIYDPDAAALLPDRDLLWQDGRVLGLGPSGSLPSSGAQVLDGSGWCALPSLADAAVFLSLEGRYPGVSTPTPAEASLPRQAWAGMDAVLDLNADRAFILAARDLDESQDLPQALFAGALFTSPDGWRVPGQTPWASNVAEVQEDADLDGPWARALRFRDQAIFAGLDSGTDTLAIPLPVLEHLGVLAHSRGLPFIVETRDARLALACLGARPDAVLGPLADLGAAPGLPRAMAAAGCAYIPSLSCVMNAFPPVPMRRWLRGFPGTASLSWAVRSEIEDPENDAVWAAHWTRRGDDPSKLLAVPKALADAGVRLVFGTGSGLPLVFHGLGAQTEVAQWLRAGLSPAQVLRAATLGSHALLGVEGGRLEPGAPADLLLVQGDPLADPELAVEPGRVFLRGAELARPDAEGIR